MAVEPSRDRFDSPTICAVFLFAAFWIFGNWPIDYVATAHQYLQPPDSFEVNYDTFLFRGYEIRQAGFPFRYYAREEDDGANPQFLAIHLLVLNVLVALTSTIACGYFVFRIRRRVQSPAIHLSNSQNLSDTRLQRFCVQVGALGIIALVLVALSTYVALNGSVDRKTAQQLSQHGIVHMYAVVPKTLQSVFPKFLLGRFARVRSAAIWERSNEFLAVVIATPTLHSLCLHGAITNQDAIIELLEKGQLKQLQVRDSQLGEALKNAIASSDRLRSVDLINCRGLRQGLPRISRESRLRAIDLTNSDVQLSLLPSKGWPQSLQRLSLPRPISGTASLLLEDIRSLESLQIAGHLYPPNSSVLDIRLKQLPALEHVGLDTEQKYSLEIAAAPRLRNIGFIESDRYSRSSFDDLVPGAHWLQSARLSGLPSLRELTVDGASLEHIWLDELPNLQRLSIGEFIGREGFEKADPSDVPAERLQTLINDLGDCDLPPQLDLSSLPLQGLDLSPLAKSRRLRSLCLARCGIEGSQLPAIVGIKRLSHLDLRGCPITDKQARNLLGQDLPLDDLLVSSERFERIEIVQQPRLRNFPANQALNARAVLIQDSPKLESELVLGNRLEHLHVRDGHALRGISINGPVPAQSELHGLRSLKFFAMGGPQVNDDLCQNLWQCNDLDHLTIAYGNLSRQSLQNIGRFAKLTVLSLPGSDIDDELVMQHWSGLRLLSEINLSHTAVSAKTAARLTALKNLQRLYVNHTKMNKRDLRDLVNVNQLIELEVAGVGLEPDTLLGCLRRGMLDRLDLSYSQVTDEMVSFLASPNGNSLAFVGLRGCSLKEEQLDRIVKAHPDLALDVANNEVSQSWLDQQNDRGRLLCRHDRKGFLQLLINSEIGRSHDFQIGNDSGRGRIDPHQFANHLSLEAKQDLMPDRARL